MIKECTNCHNQKPHHARGLCYACYKKLNFVPRIGECKRCARKMQLHAKSLCAGCYNYLFHMDKNKAYRFRKLNKIDIRAYREITACCAACGFDKLIEIHHWDRNRENGSKENLIGLCPNHHRMIKHSKFRPDVLHLLSLKGIFSPSFAQFGTKKKT